MLKKSSNVQSIGHFIVYNEIKKAQDIIEALQFSNNSAIIYIRGAVWEF